MSEYMESDERWVERYWLDRCHEKVATQATEIKRLKKEIMRLWSFPEPMRSQFDNSIYGYRCPWCEGTWKIYQDEYHQKNCVLGEMRAALEGESDE